MSQAKSTAGSSSTNPVLRVLLALAIVALLVMAIVSLPLISIGQLDAIGAAVEGSVAMVDTCGMENASMLVYFTADSGRPPLPGEWIFAIGTPQKQGDTTLLVVNRPCLAGQVPAVCGDVRGWLIQQQSTAGVSLWPAIGLAIVLVLARRFFTYLVGVALGWALLTVILAGQAMTILSEDSLNYALIAILPIALVLSLLVVGNDRVRVLQRCGVSLFVALCCLGDYFHLPIGLTIVLVLLAKAKPSRLGSVILGTFLVAFASPAEQGQYVSAMCCTMLLMLQVISGMWSLRKRSPDLSVRVLDGNPQLSV